MSYSRMQLRNTSKEIISAFIWQHILLAHSLFIMALGVALCVQSALGSSVISTVPYVMSLAGETGRVPDLTIGEYTWAMNALLVVAQILILRKHFKAVQLFQLVVGVFFGYFIDVNMSLISVFPNCELLHGFLLQLFGCCVLACGISFEIRCGSVTMPGEGITVAVSQVSGIPFPKAKIIVDISLVIIALSLGFLFFGTWLWNVVGPGTLFAMFFVGAVVKLIDPHMGWFAKLLTVKPGMKRYVYGLAKFIYRHKLD